MTLLRVPVVAVVFLLALSCREAKPLAPPPASVPPAAAAPAPAPKWKSSDSKYELFFGSFEEFTFVDLGFGGKIRVTANKRFALGGVDSEPGTKEVSLAPWLGAVRIDGYHAASASLAAYRANRGKKQPVVEKPHFVDEKLPLELHVPLELWMSRDGSQRWKGELPPLPVGHHTAASIMKGVEPLVFLDDAPAPEKPKTMLINFEFSRPLDPLLGPGTMFKDVDLVALSTWKPTGKEKKCGGYSRIPNVPGNEVVTFALDEVEVRVIDRRTAKVVAEKTFPPQTKCPGFSSGTTGAIGANADVVEAWLKSQLPK
jgi:hypothetical protein